MWKLFYSIDFKLTGVVRQAISSLYTDFQVILKFYKNIAIFQFYRP